ncbi:putative major intrinsic protein [Helianthus debilis subsp. tardiflorus]
MATVERGGAANDHHEVTLIIPKDDTKDTTPPSSPLISPQFSQKLLAELFGTYFLVFAGCGAIMVNNDKNNLLGQTGIAIVWGTAVMVMVYAVGHVSGAHINPAVTIALASCGRFPWKEVPGYVIVQILASIVASGTIWLIFDETHDHFIGNVPPGSNLQSLVMEIIITFYLMFVISSVATDDRAMGQLAGVAIGSTILLNAMFAGPVSGASMNPARSIGPALVWNEYKGLWVYILGPTIGAIGGAWAYNCMRFKPLSEKSKGASDISAMVYGVVSLFNYDLWVYLHEMLHLNKQEITPEM